ncbi:MAG: hypothetical protein Q8R88_17945 [Desulfoprunum sp.]|nr:hypothetical protein [Desulfoprunum sp.]
MELLAQKPKLEKTDAFKAEKNPNRVYDISLLRLPEIVERDGRYVVYSNRVVCDCYTKLEWLAGPDRDTSWDEAYTWVESLNSGGGMWALPPLELLRGLYRKNLRKNELSPLFHLEPTDVWSSEIKDDASAWAFNFIPGNTFWTYRTMSRRFRILAVRPKPDYGYSGK